MPLQRQNYNIMDIAIAGGVRVWSLVIPLNDCILHFLTLRDKERPLDDFKLFSTIYEGTSKVFIYRSVERN